MVGALVLTGAWFDPWGDGVAGGSNAAPGSASRDGSTFLAAAAVTLTTARPAAARMTSVLRPTTVCGSANCAQALSARSDGVTRMGPLFESREAVYDGCIRTCALRHEPAAGQGLRGIGARPNTRRATRSNARAHMNLA